MICDKAKDDGIPFVKCCSLLRISERRVQRWRNLEVLEDAKPGPVKAPHALLEEERYSILSMARDEEFMDDSHRVLAAKAADLGLFHASASSVYSVMSENDLTNDRTEKQKRNGSSKPPDRVDIDGPNQRWCWDISYVSTTVKGDFLYLFALLDEYSRKLVAWRISWNMTHKEGMELLQEGLEDEELDDIDVALPDLINDRGTQMKAKPFMQLCEDLGIGQKFSRPRTPNDNPYIESFFSIVKGDSNYPRTFIDDIGAIAYFTAYFDYYNHSRLHGGINMVTPIQKHTGVDKVIIQKRKVGLIEARKKRLCKNRERSSERKLALSECRV